ncbi:MAG: DNA replication initiation control protein YabA [Alicyclobacillaceae bacterium]|nr:DNA replication initiation control protein YabA [Alicyclobacillaceae bacterium]
MDKQSLFVQVANLEERIGELYVELGALKQKIVELLEENQRLLRENEFLSESLKAGGNPDIGVGMGNLKRIYDEGFHICSMRYGSLRTEGECLFCLSFINR